jgi:hypothetical protein
MSLSNRLLKNGIHASTKLSTNGKNPTFSITTPFTLSVSKGVPRIFQQPASTCVAHFLRIVKTRWWLIFGVRVAWCRQYRFFAAAQNDITANVILNAVKDLDEDESLKNRATIGSLA